MRRNIKLNENDLARIVRRVLSEESEQPLQLFKNCQDKMNSLIGLVGKNNMPGACFRPITSSDNIDALEQKCLDSLEPLYVKKQNNLDYGRIRSRGFKNDVETMTAIVELNQCKYSSDMSNNDIFN